MKNFSGIFIIFICLAIIFSSGCTSPTSTTTAPGVASTQSYTSQPASVSPTHFSGSAPDTQGFTVTRGGGFMLTGSHQGKYYFSVNIKDNNGEYVDMVVFNVNGPYNGRSVVHLDPGKYFFEVFASGPWTIDISPT